MKVTNTQARMISIAGLHILPGHSATIPEKHVEGVKKSSVFRAKWLVPGEVHVETKPLDLSKMTPDQAKKVIALETDIKALSAWVDSEKRPEVLVAIKSRLGAL